MASSSELRKHEDRAQRGIIEFAEEMQFIRDSNLYPGAKSAPDAWKSYCKERWGMGKGIVDSHIRAMPVLKRLTVDGVDRVSPSISAADTVATLDVKVQDAILDSTAKRDDVKLKAKAARKIAKTADQNGLTEEESIEKQIEAANAAKPPRKPKRKMKDSKFIGRLSTAEHYSKSVADYVRTNKLSDTENDFGWAFVERVRLHMDTVAEALYQPEHVKDWDQEAAALLGGDDS